MDIEKILFLGTVIGIIAGAIYIVTLTKFDK